MNYSNLMDAVNARIKVNGRREITGDILNDVLRAMVVELGAGYQLGGTIRPGDKPKDEDLRVAYLAVEPGMYLYAGGFEVTELSLITYGGEWYMYPLGVPFGSQIAEDIAAAVEVEKTRAMAAEKDLSDAIDTEKTERAAADSVLDSAIKAEAKRATDAEGVLAKAVADEKTRAMSAEGANAAAIASEADARAQADTTLQGNITAEATAREAADATLQSEIDKKVSKDDDTLLENFMPKIVLNKNGSVKSVTVGDNVAANYSIVSTLLSRYGGVVTGAVTGYQDEPVLGRVVQVFVGGDALFVTAIFNYAENFSRKFANSIYEIVLNYNSEGDFVSGTYKFKQIGEVFQIGLFARSSSEMTIDKTYEDFQKMGEDYQSNGALPLIILNDGWTSSSFILTRYYRKQYNDAQYPGVFQLSFISFRDKQLIGYYIVVEKNKTTITPFEFQPTTKDELDEAIAAMNTSVDEKIAQFQNDVGEALDYLQAEIGKKQDIISDLATIRANAANGQTAFGWGDHAKAGYTKAFIVNITGDGSTENPYTVDKTREEVAAALAANSLILLKGGEDGISVIYSLLWATDYPSQSIMLKFGSIDGVSLNYSEIILVFSYQDGVAVSVMANNYKLASGDNSAVILNYNGLGGNNEPIFVNDAGTALTRVQICTLLNGVNANRVILKNKASAVAQTSSAKLLQCDANTFIIGFEGANASGQIFDILYSWDATAAKVLRADLLYNPTA